MLTPVDVVVRNDSPSSPLQFITEDGKVIGKFYNSKDKLHHLAAYVPYGTPPSVFMCGGHGNFSPTREDGDRIICPECFALIHRVPNH